MWKKRFSDFDQKTSEKLKFLVDQQKKEVEEFQRNWSEVYPIRYRKPSPQYLQLKQIEKSFALSGQYEKARQINLEAEKQGQKEVEAQEKLMLNDYLTAKNKLADKHLSQMKEFQANRNHKMNVLKQEYEMERVTLDNRKKVIHIKGSPSRSQPFRNSTPLRTTGFSFQTPIDKKLLLPALKPPIELAESNPKITKKYKTAGNRIIIPVHSVASKSSTQLPMGMKVIDPLADVRRTPK